MIFILLVHLFFPFFVFGYDRIFPKFGSIPSDDFWGIGSCFVEFHLCKFGSESFCFDRVSIEF